MNEFDFDFVSVLLGLSFGVYTVRVTISCIYYFVFTISFYFIYSINLSGYLAASYQLPRTYYYYYYYYYSETAEYFQQTTLQLPSSDPTPQQQQPQQRDGRQSTTGSQLTLTTAAAPVSATSATGTGSGDGGVVTAVNTGDVVINVDEKQPLIARSDHILTIDRVITKQHQHSHYDRLIYTGPDFAGGGPGPTLRMDRH